MKERINKCKKQITSSFASFFNRAVRKEISRNLTLILFAIVIGVFIQTLRKDLNLATALVAFGTLILAFFTSLSIINSRDRENRDRKDRLLNEIIEWAVDVFNCDIEVLQIVNVNDVKAYIMNLQQRYEAVNVKNYYIIKIASLFGKDLRMAAEKVTFDLGEHIKVIKHLYNDEVDPKKLGEHRYTLKQSANKVIEEAAKIKTRDIR